jgi:hypothetical protein
MSANNPILNTNQIPWTMMLLMLGLVVFINIVTILIARNNSSPWSTHASGTNASPKTYAAPPAPMTAQSTE